MLQQQPPKLPHLTTITFGYAALGPAAREYLYVEVTFAAAQIGRAHV